jgi:uncharacterized membrane protein YuzA (DUF378 family)
MRNTARPVPHMGPYTCEHTHTHTYTHTHIHTHTQPPVSGKGRRAVFFFCTVLYNYPSSLTIMSEIVKSAVKELKNPASTAELLIFIGGINWLFVAMKMRKEPEPPNDLILFLSNSKVGKKVPRVAGVASVQQTVYFAVGVATLFHMYVKREKIKAALFY